MKRIVVFSVVAIMLLGIGGYALYRYYMAELVARAVLSDTLPDYIPKRLKTKVEAIKRPLNNGTEAILHKMHASEIPVSKVLEVVDNTTEEQAYAFLDAVNEQQPSNADEVFDLAKKHFPANFNLEVLRQPFKEHFDMKQIGNAIAYANMNRQSNDVDFATAKAILKKIIIEKEKEVISKR